MKSSLKLALFLFLVIVALSMLYFFEGRGWVADWLHGADVPLLDQLTRALYPRLLVERHRYEADILLFYADQFIGRTMGVGLLSTGLILWFQQKPNLHHTWNSFWAGEISTTHYKGLNFVFFLVVAYFGYDLLPDLLHLHQLKSLYQPVSFLWLFDIPYPLIFFIYLYVITMVIFCLIAAVGIRSLFFSLYIMVIFIVLQAFVFSFEKTDHHLSTITYALLLMPFMHHSATNQLNPPIWPLKLIQISVGLSYGLSALEKISITGFNWPQEALCGYLKTYAVDIPYCVAIGYGLLLFQLTFILIVFYPKLRWIYLPIGTAFHILVFVFTGIGGWLHPWWLMYLFFLDWSFIGKHLPQGWKDQKALVQ